MVYPFLSHNYADADIKQIYICQSFAFIFPSPFTRAQLCTVQLTLSSSLLWIINAKFQFSKIQSVDKSNQSGQFVTHIYKTHKKSNIFFCPYLIYYTMGLISSIFPSNFSYLYQNLQLIIILG